MLFLCALPLVQNLWAYYTWERAPCTLAPEGLFSSQWRKYFFELNGLRYPSHIRDFWDSTNVAAWRSLGTKRLDPPNTFCYVSPGDPSSAVLRLDAHKRLDLAAPRLGITALLVAATAIMSRAARQRRSPATTSDPAKAA